MTHIPMSGHKVISVIIIGLYNLYVGVIFFFSDHNDLTKFLMIDM